jgi:hypothetical protein
MEASGAVHIVLVQNSVRSLLRDADSAGLRETIILADQGWLSSASQVYCRTGVAPGGTAGGCISDGIKR